jgi:RimJ/RimL family protein N-acetyltransferase
MVPDDITDLYVNGLNDPEVNRYLSGPRREYQTHDTVRAFVAANAAAADAILFGLFIDQELRGTVRLHDVSHASAYVGLAFFDKRIWGKGWAKLAIKRVCRFAFDDLRVASIFAGVHDANEASRRSFQRVGFRSLQQGIDDEGRAYTVWVLQPDQLLSIARGRTRGKSREQS